MEAQSQNIKPPKSTKEELRKRINSVMDWILNDYSTTQIISSCMAQWNVSSRQAERYIYVARNFIKGKDQQSIDQKKAYYLARKRKAIRDMAPEEKKTASGASAIDQITNSMARLDGLLQSPKGDVSINVQSGTIKIGYGAEE